MRVCSFCGERNEDWMEICQRCGNSIVNDNQVNDYKASSKNNNSYSYSYNQDDNFVDNSKVEKKEYKEYKEPRIIQNMDLKIIIIILLIILIGLIAYTIFVIS